MGAPVHTARFAPGVIGQIMDGEGPARVPDNVIDELRAQRAYRVAEEATAGAGSRLQINDRLRIQTGPLRGPVRALRRSAAARPREIFPHPLDVKGCVELDTRRLCVVSRRKRC